MRCDDIRELLDDTIDARLDEADRKRVAAHLDACPDCEAEARALRGLVNELRSMPEAIEPASDLWPAIDARLDEEEEYDAPELASPEPPARFWTAPVRPGLWQGLLAASVLLAAFALGYVIRPMLEPVPDAPAVSGPAPGTAAASREAPRVAAEISLLEVKQQLRASLDRHRESLSPETAQMVDRNLAVIERSIEEIRKALRDDPGNRELKNMLMAAHRREINLLRRVNEVAARL